MTSSAQALNTLKNRMQAVRDELEKYRELYEQKCREEQEQLDKNNQVCLFIIDRCF